MKKLHTLTGSLFVLFAMTASAQTPVEVKLVSALDEARGWCIDLRGGAGAGEPIGGLHGHTCYTYNGNGPTNDQAFIMEGIRESNEFRMVAFNDLCMTLWEPRDGSFISIETCDDRAQQDFVLNDTGQIRPDVMPELCLTLNSVTVPGGGGNPLHLMRDVSFSNCDDGISERQTWELRTDYDDGPQEVTVEPPYVFNPAGAMGMGPGMGAP
ncbi:MAG TPA: RICIN domain-containing protein [Gammaproteobacteria bacterium]|nr:RICIN domain-containing protein [Gammaproteobacteria bacterium]